MTYNEKRRLAIAREINLLRAVADTCRGSGGYEVLPAHLDAIATRLERINHDDEHVDRAISVADMTMDELACHLGGAS